MIRTQTPFVSQTLLVSQQRRHAWEELGHYLSGAPARNPMLKSYHELVKNGGGAQVEGFRNIIEMWCAAHDQSNCS